MADLATICRCVQITNIYALTPSERAKLVKALSGIEVSDENDVDALRQKLQEEHDKAIA